MNSKLIPRRVDKVFDSVWKSANVPRCLSEIVEIPRFMRRRSMP